MAVNVLYISLHLYICLFLFHLHPVATLNMEATQKHFQK